MKAVCRLRDLGYKVTQEGERIDFEYLLVGEPEASEEVEALIKQIRTNKSEALRFLQQEADSHAGSKIGNEVPMEWDAETRDLITWFEAQQAPEEPFDLDHGRKVVNPTKFWEALRRSIDAGPAGPRARALRWDLRVLRRILE